MEIERKFKLNALPDQLETYPKKEIEQGYLCRGPIVRIRKSNEDYILTYKSKFGLKEGQGKSASVCNEVEVPLNQKGYEHLKEKIDDNLIVKTRYLIPLEGDLVAELDVFHGALEGLQFVEVEFPSEKAAEEFKAPSWFGEDVSFERKYHNNELIGINSYEEFEAMK